jgi:acetyl-CoA carboxylase biotin carboxyl carrier protein
VSLNLGELRDLLTAINQTDIEELTLKSDDFELTVRRSLRVSPTPAPIISVVSVPDAGASLSAPAGSGTLEGSSSATPTPTPPTQAVPPPKNERKLLEIISPMVGTFYRAPAPDEAPFVEVGDRIKAGQTVCIIEAMKLMNELETEVSGEIVEVLVQNGEPVEYGQPLMRVSP